MANNPLYSFLKMVTRMLVFLLSLLKCVTLQEFTGDSSDSSSNSRTGSLIARLDTRISLDLLISLTVQSCAIRFEGRQQVSRLLE